MNLEKYKTIYADPPWQQTMSGKYKKKKHKTLDEIEYPTMTLDDIKNIPVREIAEIGCHLWLWTTNQFLKQGFEVMESWGFKYLSPITWVKPSGIGNYFVHRTQTLLFGYKERCFFNNDRYKPTVIFAPTPRRHSEKPIEVYELIESISDNPRIELFARQKRLNWDVWGNEIESDIIFT
jgi:N6-adenosine-specific RNA methylase IME4